MLSILVVSLNANEGLSKTINSILEQTCDDYEIIVKDGGSKDGSLERIPASDRIFLYQCKDTGIYDAMNQATTYARGSHVLFMNCGDTFYSEDCIEKIHAAIQADKEGNTIFYGDCYTVNRNSVVRYPEQFDDYVCFTKTLCHQATVFPIKLFAERKYQLQYKTCADFEYYVHAYCSGVRFCHLPYIIANYEGGGASEVYENRKNAISEKKEILRKCFTKDTYTKNWVKMQLHGAGIKQLVAGSKYFYGLYSQCAGMIYRIKNR